MSTADHNDAVTDQPGEFNQASGSDPILHDKHKPGLPVSPTDEIPTFHGKVLSPGEAPADKTFKPNAADFPSQANNPDMSEEAETSAGDTLGGATSGDVYKGLGKPQQGQSSAEVRHGGQHPGKKIGYGLAAQGVAGELGAANPRIDERQRALDKDEATPGRGDKGSVAAEDLPPESA